MWICEEYIKAAFSLLSGLQEENVVGHTWWAARKVTGHKLDVNTDNPEGGLQGRGFLKRLKDPKNSELNVGMVSFLRNSNHLGRVSICCIHPVGQTQRSFVYRISKIEVFLLKCMFLIICVSKTYTENISLMCFLCMSQLRIKVKNGDFKIQFLFLGILNMQAYHRPCK